ncbi:MAG: DUF3325 family protein [Tsuneonella suprasediminis]|nr:DUF3325 family protein [Altererythrobacter sp. N1]
MTLEAGLIGYCALTLLALSMPKHRRPLGLAHLPSERMARWSGWLVLGVSAIIAWHGLGFALGSTLAGADLPVCPCADLAHVMETTAIISVSWGDSRNWHYCIGILQ